MLYLLIKLWWKRRLDRMYYMRVTTPIGHTRDAVKFAKSLKQINLVTDDYKDSLSSSMFYAEHMLGHSTLNAVANVSGKAFIMVVGQVPLLYQNDDTKMLCWIGRQAMEHSDYVLDASYASDVVERVFGITDLPRVPAHRHTREELNLLMGVSSSWNEYIANILSMQLDKVEREVDALVFSKVTGDKETLSKKLSTYWQVARAYNFTATCARAHNLNKKLMKGE